ncbi:MAG TPA: hypothetical protein DET40_22555 [Lentisphaeria bacterium]|nr:MAG: hypothetical protein A2X45_17285 [Lentisphaerae bacterium GWF2_50_93]HCE46337.1 hypothetical protein [Lentisphaeria bacterium]
MRNLTLFASILSSIVFLQSSVYSADSFNADFENLAQSPKEWKIQGKVSIDTQEASKGKNSMLFERTEKTIDDPTSLKMEPFPVKEGVWELGVSYKTSLYSPDSSYNGAIILESMDSSGKVIDKAEFAIIYGKSEWKLFKKNVEIPDGAATARFKVVMNKTYGKFSIDDLSAKYVSPSPNSNSIFSAIKFSSDSLGNIFYPGDKLSFNVIVECRKDWQAENREVSCVISDYWGAECSEPMKIKLVPDEKAGGKIQYKGKIDLGAAKLESGKYYDIHGTAEFAGQPPYKEKSSFALLPKPAAKSYKPSEIPFVSNSWDNRIKEHFYLSDRLGLRWCGVFSGWGAKAPYEAYAPGIEHCKTLGMGAVLGCGPVHAIEYHNGNYKDFDETALREGAKNMIMKFKDTVPLLVRMGNEPHGDAERVKEDIVAYKAVYEGVKQADPKIIVIGSSCGTAEEFFKQGFQNYLDVYDFHTYEDPITMRTTFKRYSQLFAKYGDCRKPIWSTEIGLNAQGMSHISITRDMIKKFAVFFAEGGQLMSWFDIFYPDPGTKREGTNSEAFDVFYTKYCLYSPKMMAVAYYNMVNGICIKKFIQEKIYDGGIDAVLFRDKDNQCLAIVWKEKTPQDVFLPLAGVGKTRIVRIDGSSTELDAGGKGLTLTISENPVLLFFESSDMKLSDKLEKPAVSIAGEIIPVIKGEDTKITINAGEVPAGDISITAPQNWIVKSLGAEDKKLSFSVTAPANTDAREGRLLLGMKNKGGELSIPVPITGRLSMRIVPEPFKDGVAGLKLVISNNSSVKEDVRYAISIPEEILMDKGTFNKAAAIPFTAAITGQAEGKLTLEGKSQKEFKVSVSNYNPLNIYKAKVLLVDSSGKTMSKERLISGFVGVGKVKSPLKMDLAADEAEWQRAPLQNISEERQYYKLGKTAAWKDGRDLSGKLRFLWDDSYLYMRMDVADDKYVNQKSDSAIWNMDGLQILVDSARESSEKSGKYEYAFAEGTKGPQAWCNYSADSTTPTGETKDIVVKVTKATDGTGSRTYEIAIPWLRLTPFKPVAGNNLGMCVIINEDDGPPGRQSFMGWFGCAHSKQLDLVGDLILME